MNIAWHDSNVRTTVHDVPFKSLEREPVVPEAKEAGTASRSLDNRRNSLDHLVLSLEVLLGVLELSAAPIYIEG